MTTANKDLLALALQHQSNKTPDMGLEVRYCEVLPDYWRIDISTYDMRNNDGICKYEIRYFLSLAETLGLSLGIYVDTKPGHQYVSLS